MPDTVALLDSLGGALSTSPVIVAATVRDDSPGSWVARELARIPGAIHVRLGQIGFADAAVMVEQSRPDLAETQRRLVITRAEGVPLVIEGLLTGTSDRLKAWRRPFQSRLPSSSRAAWPADR
jgi:hypothetical protein